MRADLYASAGMGGVPAQYSERERVRKATTADLPALASSMAAAFYDDPVAGWSFKDAARRMRRLEQGFELFIRRLYLPHGECFTTDDVVGGALWVPLGKWRTGVVDQLRLLAPMARNFGRELPRVFRGLGALESQHPHEPHYYLPFVGVRPESQGRGIGAALMRPVLERCDREEVPAYLEATSPRNRALYERHGFEVSAVLEMPGDCPPAWAMWREPRGSAVQ